MALRAGAGERLAKARTHQAPGRSHPTPIRDVEAVDRKPSALPHRKDSTSSSVRSRSAAYSTDEVKLRKLIAKTGRVAIDLETDGFHPHKPNRNLAQFRQDAGAAEEGKLGLVIARAGGQNFLLREFPDWWPEVLEDSDAIKTITNAKFDLTWMIADEDRKGRTLSSVQNIRDPMLLGQLVHRYKTKTGAAKAGNPGAWEPNDLGSLLQEWNGVTIKKGIDHDKTYWPGKLSPEMIDYALEDITELDNLGDFLQEEVERQAQERAAWIENETVFGTAWMTYNGIQPDVSSWGCSLEQPEWHTVKDKSHHGECRGAIAEWRSHFMHLEKFHLRKKWPGVENFNSPAQILRAAPHVLGGPIPNTQKATLKQLAEVFPEVEMLLEHRHYGTRLKNWGPAYLKEHVCPGCARFHPDWRQIGTETSRFSCSFPNLQQIPRSPEFRKLFVASPGCSLASLDYSAIEVLTAAIYAADQNLLAACATGDPHSAVARMTLGMSDDEWENLDYLTRKNYRQNAKIVNFGLLFGGGAEGLVTQARDLFDTVITLTDARVMIYQFYRLFPGLKAQRNKAYQAMDSREQVIEIRNGVGFRRYLEKLNRKPTSWLNTWIQSTAGYGLKSSFRYLRIAGLLPFLVAQIHDELIFEFPGDPDSEEVLYLVSAAKECLIAGMRDVLGANAPVIVDDTAVGRTWL